MKKYLLGLFFILTTVSICFSQELSYGLKAGVNHPMGGEIVGLQNNYAFQKNTSEAEGNLGFHGGIFLQVDFGKFFVRPEVVYTSLDTEFTFIEETSIYSVQKFDIPLLVGYNIWGPIDIYAGPVYSNILDATLEGEEFLNPIVVQDTPINAQAGVKVEFGRFGLDLRYERSLSSAELQRLDFGEGYNEINEAEFTDSRLNQIIVGVIFKIGGPGLNERRRRACY
ncbi:outer membrane beta-barrel protein [Salinimicrobium sp. MT39]|uniref:Outer membrane beta-barrel protein n=1 Tax=Salinimicrobium profundisediminis TaxID=2994553 RepID=A0A9X3I104_9FLAO|nr:outer membrane beta-barrel protein [Salinimicrobium profundisediminis]MCX2837457.1 outer membrane beta-barrel protein [Salinimicrobium profundisediminis]